MEEITELKVPLTEVQEDLKKLRDIRYWVRKATPGTEESKEPPKKQPIKEVLQDKADEKKAQGKAVLLGVGFQNPFLVRYGIALALQLVLMGQERTSQTSGTAGPKQRSLRCATCG